MKMKKETEVLENIETDTKESVKLILGRIILFVVTFLALITLNMCIDIQLYNNVIFSFTEEIINIILAAVLSTFLFNVFCVEYELVEEGDE